MNALAINRIAHCFSTTALREPINLALVHMDAANHLIKVA